MDYSKILSSILAGISLEPNSKRLFVICLVGLPGSGKSTVSKLLSEQLSIPIMENDIIRIHLDTLGISREDNQQKLVEEISLIRTNLLFANKVSHIIDADMYMFVEQAKTNIEKYGGSIILIKISADEEKVVNRITTRAATMSTNSRAGMEKFQERKKLYEEQSRNFDYFYEINNDSLESLKSQVKKICEKLKVEGFINA